jgi:site-specific DNA recombinase
MKEYNKEVHGMIAAIYARYSSDNQREESIDAQVRAINEYAQKNGHSIVKIYSDEARSATTDNRPQFLQMMRDSAMGLFNAVIIHKLDRFSRDRYDSAFYKRQFKKNGVKLISVLENLDDSPESIILESVLEGMAEYYSANLSREVMKGMRETAYQCKHNGGIPPLGYDVLPDKTYAINNYEATILKEIFELYAAGNGYSKIIQLLNQKGYKTKVGKSFGSNSLHELLVNEKYIGTYVFNKVPKMFNGKRNSHHFKSEEEIIKVENGLPAIISKELWDEVSKKMSTNRRAKAANSAKEVYLLSGIIYCGKCECAMTGTRKFSGRNKTLYLSYECSGRKRKHICDMKAVGKDFVENVVIDQLIRDMFSPKAIDKLADKLASHASIMIKQISKNIIEFENELNGTEKQIDNLLNAIANGMFQQSMKDKLETLENKKAHLFILVEEAKIQMAINSPSRENIHSYLEKDADIKNKSLEDQKRIIQTYVQKVVVHDDRIDTDTIVNFIGGGEGSRTPVRNHFHKNFYGCSLCFMQCHVSLAGR